MKVRSINVGLKIRRIGPKNGLEMGFGPKQLGLKNLGPKNKNKNSK